MSDIELPNPHSRLEHYLSIIAGREGAVLPKGIQSRLESYLLYIIEHGGGGGGGASPALIAPEYQPFNTYQSGALVFHNQELYVALDNGITGEWDSTKWRKTDVSTVTKLLSERIDNIGSVGRYLSGWDCTTGLPVTNPEVFPYQYMPGDYYTVSKVGAVNYMPNGKIYTGIASTTIDTGDPRPFDMYKFDGTVWTWFDFGEEFRQILSDYYPKESIDTMLNNKANKGTLEIDRQEREISSHFLEWEIDGTQHSYEVVTAK